MTQNDRDTLAVIPGVPITFAQYARTIERNVMINLRVGMPAEVLVFYPPVPAGPLSKPAMVDVLPHFIFVVAINSVAELTPKEIALGWVLGEEDGGYVKKSMWSIIRNVPVHYAGHAGMYSRGPLKLGEVGYLKVPDRSTDKWIQTGGPVDPGFAQFHDFTDAFFEPGLRYGVVSAPMDITKHVIGSEDGSAGMFIDDVEEGVLPNIALTTLGEEATIDAIVGIKLGLAATLAAARQTDPVNPGVNMTAWATTVETAINVLAPGTFTPANSFATTVATVDSGNFGRCGQGSLKTTIE